MALSSLEEFTREISAALDAALEKSREVSSLVQKIQEGRGTYADADRLASLTGRSTGKAVADGLAQNSVDGKVAEEVARAALIRPLEHNYNIVADACETVQKSLNKKAGLGLNAVRPEFNRDRAEGLVTEILGKDDVPSFAGTIIQQIENVSMSTVDDSVRVNADAHYNAGLSPKIERIADSKCCEWCNSLAGTYEYSRVNNTGNDVFRRHANCRCQVLYDPGNGKKWQDAHSKRLISADESAKIEARKKYGLYEEWKTPEHRVAIAEMFQKEKNARDGFHFISDERFDQLTVQARKSGATILRGTPEIEEHLDKNGKEKI